MKRIVINALSARIGGGQTYIRNFLSRVDNTHEYIVLVGTYNREIFANAAVGKSNIRFIDCGKKQANPLRRLFWERFKLPRLLRELKTDIYYAAGGGTLTQVPKGIVSATIVRNMLPFDERERARFPFFTLSRLKLSLLRYIALYAIRRSDKVIFISHYSKEIVTRTIPEVNRKGIVIYHGVDEHFLNPAENSFDFSALGIVKGKFYLYVSIFNHYKAQAELVREWRLLSQHQFQYPLVLTGFHEPGYTEHVRNMILKTKQEHSVLMTEPVPYEKLPDYYAGARALIFASSCECCPNILLEMMAAGKPLFCSNYPPMPEIGGNTPFYFNPYKKGDLAEKVIQFEKNFETNAPGGVSNRKRAETFSWETTVSETIRFLTDASPGESCKTCDQ